MTVAQKITNLLRENGAWRSAAIAVAVGHPAPTVRRTLQEMEKKQLIHVGFTGKNTQTYELRATA